MVTLAMRRKDILSQGPGRRASGVSLPSQAAPGPVGPGALRWAEVCPPPPSPGLSVPQAHLPVPVPAPCPDGTLPRWNLGPASPPGGHGIAIRMRGTPSRPRGSLFQPPSQRIGSQDPHLLWAPPGEACQQSGPRRDPSEGRGKGKGPQEGEGAARAPAPAWRLQVCGLGGRRRHPHAPRSLAAQQRGHAAAGGTAANPLSSQKPTLQRPPRVRGSPVLTGLLGPTSSHSRGNCGIFVQRSVSFLLGNDWNRDCKGVFLEPSTSLSF